MSHVSMHPLEKEDVLPLVAITRETKFFRPEEVQVAEEVLTAALSDKDYHVHVAKIEKQPVGYICFGKTPMTKGTWDIYWIVVDRSFQKHGIGKKLIMLAETEIQKNQGYLIIIETSSQELYVPTHRFYLSINYQELIRVPNFYDVGDDKVIYIKNLK